MRVAELWRYPVKSMLGHHLDEVTVGPGGVLGDRRFAVIDVATGKVGSAKQPRLWRSLLRARATDLGGDGEVRITLPDGGQTTASDPAVHDLLSTMLGRPVRLSAVPFDQADIDRADPDEVLDQGVEAVVAAPQLVLGEAVPAATFLDYAPLHLITTATLEHIGRPVARYRPNLVIRTPPWHPPFAENAWVGSTMALGEVVVRVVLPTPRCAIPTLDHGDLPRDPGALRTLMAQNRVEVPGFGVLPAAGVYATVEQAGALRSGDAVRIGR
jgi:uncharacterized protein YcbX